MSRNLCNGSVCAFCHGAVECVEAPRPITKDDCGIYFPEYEGMIVANAACVDCEAPYLAWLDGGKRGARAKGWGYDYPTPRWEEGRLIPGDLSHRQAFNDEPGPNDYPKYQMVRVRQPWPKCIVCDAPLRRPGGECDRVYDHKQAAPSVSEAGAHVCARSKGCTKTSCIFDPDEDPREVGYPPATNSASDPGGGK